jgi:vancomycin resistance protein YoaR
MKRFIAALLSVMLCLSLFTAGSGALAEERVSARTPLSGSDWAKLSNIEIAASHINGVVVPYGMEFSFNNTVGPRTAAYGYQPAYWSTAR